VDSNDLGAWSGDSRIFAKNRRSVVWNNTVSTSSTPPVHADLVASLNASFDGTVVILLVDGRRRADAKTNICDLKALKTGACPYQCAEQSRPRQTPSLTAPRTNCFDHVRQALIATEMNSSNSRTFTPPVVPSWRDLGAEWPRKKI